MTGTLHPDGWGAAMGYPAIVLGENGLEVEGCLLSSDELSDHWAELDDFEGEAYERVLAVVKLKDDSTVDAYIYVLKDEREATKKRD